MIAAMSPSVPRLRIGSAEIIALADADGPFFSPRAEAFPEATAAQWAEADRYDPGAVDAGAAGGCTSARTRSAATRA
ncbi:hypothetical protein ACFQ0B_54025 [Nonomuraea thailandensis]